MHRAALLLLFFVFFFSSCTFSQSPELFTVLTHPDGPLYVGDRVSFEVLAPAGFDTDGASVRAEFDGQELGTSGYAPYGIGSRSQATLWWAWNTSGLKPGNQTLTFTSLPDGRTWTETVRLRPSDQVPPPEPEAHWSETTTACCDIYYITGTDAARDIRALSRTADAESAAVAAQLGTSPLDGMSIVLLSKLIGHGGFTWGSVYVSYYDANYIGNDMNNLFHHEMVHYYDAALGGDYRPAILEEGLAVYLTGGHFKPEPLGPRAAALLDLGWYIPLPTLADDFYYEQHDISYLEAGALVKYLVETYGWGAFNEFYRTMPALADQSDSAILDAALRRDFGLSFADLETAYLANLRAQTVSADVRTDLQLTVAFFDDVRRYQAALDPSDYFLTAWLPDGNEMRKQGIVADFLRHPTGFRNLLVEGLLSRAQAELFSGQYEAAGQTLRWANAALDLVAP